MKAVAVVGFKNSGKSCLVGALAGALKARGCRVGIIKHAHRAIEVADKDSRLYARAREVVVVSDKETSSLRKGTAGLQELISGMKADIVIVEGFKQDKTLPRIVCYKDRKEKAQLTLGLELGFVKTGKLGAGDVRKLAAAAREKGFKLPAEDCAKCGYKNCYELAKAIVKGKEDDHKCVYSPARARLWVGGASIPMKLFVDDILVNTVRGFVKSLRGGQAPGRIKIEID